MSKTRKTYIPAEIRRLVAQDAHFNPRTQSWAVHFAWSEDGMEIIGLTAAGRATVVALCLNNDEIVAARSLWVQAGWHPPDD